MAASRRLLRMVLRARFHLIVLATRAVIIPVHATRPTRPVGEYNPLHIVVEVAVLRLSSCCCWLRFCRSRRLPPPHPTVKTNLLQRALPCLVPWPPSR